MRANVVCASCVCLLLASYASASTITYQFSGTVTFANAKLTPFGLAVPMGAAVNGQFQYDPASLPTHTLANGIGYEQDYLNGFQMQIGPVSVTTSSYVVAVSNNILQPGNVLSDGFAVLFASNLSPTLGSPLTVNGTDHSAGLFSLQFIGGSGLYSDTSLPTSLSLASLPTTLGQFSDVANSPKVLFTLTSLVVVPEPATWQLVVVGGLVGLPAARGLARRKGRSHGVASPASS